MAALDQVRSKDKRLPFIMVSGAQGEELAVEALLRGSTDYVLKQRLNRLVPAVKRALAEHADYLLREAAERERDTLTERLDQVMTATSDAIIMVDRNWVMTFANAKAIEIYSFEGSVLEKNVWDAFPDAWYEGSPFVEHFKKAMRRSGNRRPLGVFRNCPAASRFFDGPEQPGSTVSRYGVQVVLAFRRREEICINVN